MNRYLQLFRTGNALMGVVGSIIACFMAAGLDIADSWQNILICAAVVFCFICGGNALNDYIDYEIDRTAHPERPIPSGRMERKEAFNAAVVMLVASVVLSFLTMDIVCIIVVAIAAGFMVAYEMGLKQRGFVGNVTIALLTGMMFLLGGAVVGDIKANLLVALMAMFVSIGREISKDIEDMESDEGRSTLPMRIGVKGASAVASVFFVLGPVVCIYPLVMQTYEILFDVVIIALAIFCYCAVVVFKDPHKAQKMAKFGMIAGLVAFVLGVIPI
jgi:geranylgeranylglycerol-phosphate geranylgeranyltransferase